MSDSFNKNQWTRLRNLAGMLRRGNAVNLDNFITYMLFDDENFEISPRTFARDINTLRELGADIRYRQKYKCFELKNKDWTWEIPMEIDSVKPLLLSERVAQNFLPQQIRKKLRETVDSIFMSYKTDLPKETSFSAFQVITPEFSPKIDSEIFRQVYQAWENSNYLKISYCSIKGHQSEKLIAPRVFAWDNGCWYVKGFVAKEDGVALEQPWNIRVFALHRIQKAEVSQGKFIPDEDEISLINGKDLFDFKKYDEVEIEFFRPEADRIKERFSSDTDAIIAQSDNSVTIRLKDVSEYTVFPLIFRAMGNARVIKPACLQESLKKVAENIFGRMM